MISRHQKATAVKLAFAAMLPFVAAGVRLTDRVRAAETPGENGVLPADSETPSVEARDIDRPPLPCRLAPRVGTLPTGFRKERDTDEHPRYVLDSDVSVQSDRWLVLRLLKLQPFDWPWKPRAVAGWLSIDLSTGEHTFLSAPLRGDDKGFRFEAVRNSGYPISDTEYLVPFRCHRAKKKAKGDSGDHTHEVAWLWNVKSNSLTYFGNNSEWLGLLHAIDYRKYEVKGLCDEAGHWTGHCSIGKLGNDQRTYELKTAEVELDTTTPWFPFFPTARQPGVIRLSRTASGDYVLESHSFSETLKSSWRLIVSRVDPRLKVGRFSVNIVRGWSTTNKTVPLLVSGHYSDSIGNEVWLVEASTGRITRRVKIDGFFVGFPVHVSGNGRFLAVTCYPSVSDSDRHVRIFDTVVGEWIYDDTKLVADRFIPSRFMTAVMNDGSIIICGDKHIWKLAQPYTDDAEVVFSLTRPTGSVPQD